MDRMTPEQRSYTMSRIRAKNTGIERLVFQQLQKRKIYFKKHHDKLPGCPDLVFTKKKVVIFVNSSFWHGWNFNKWKNRLKPYWLNKISGNILRDRKNYHKLKKTGWTVIKIWDHQLKKDENKVINKILQYVGR